MRKMPRHLAGIGISGKIILFAWIMWIMLNLAGCGLLPSESGTSEQEQAARQQARFEARLANLRVDYHIPGMSVIVLRGEEELFAGGFGHADLETQSRASVITPYRIASLTKPMAATLIMQLVEEGRIDLDQPFATYDPAYADLCVLIRTGYAVADYNCESERITVRHHLSHTTQGRPGDFFLYQGGIYGLLSRVVENVTGQPFEQRLLERIIQPLNMRSTAISQHQASPRLLDALAQPYHVDALGNASPSAYPPMDTDAAAGVISTVVDLATFSIALDHDVLISAESRQQMWTPMRSNAGQPLPYGLGWFVQDINGTRVVWHFGWWPDAFSSLLVKVPDQNVTCIMLANSDGLSGPFDIGPGNILNSPFAVAFLAEYTDLNVVAGK